MTDALMTIREMCETFDVTPRTLRFYEAKELLYPIRDGQKRLFTRRDRGRLKLILRGKRFGFSLEDIRQLLDLYDMDAQHQLQIREVVAKSRERLTEMRRQRDDLDVLISELAEMIEMGDRLMTEKAAITE